ncbi:MAG: OmpH family outer membrane protein [Paludibacter sp.]|jgi:outer membrane protein|nr:OmpH family outer membrane protein [Paludibacter sp.]
MNKNSLILLSLVLNAILVLAVIILFARVYGNSGGAKQVNNNFQQSDSVCYMKLPIAYINIDSLLLNYEFAKESNEALTKKMEDARYNINSKAQTLQRDMQEFQRKLETNSFLSRERAEQAQQALIKRQQDLQELDNSLQQQLMKQQADISEQLRDTINTFLKNYNAAKKYDIILSNTSSDNILQAADGYDITAEVIQILNSRYKKK